ncbi:MAG: era [Gammaproteobacteria bacterium]|jgi:GTP-binding protein Era|nr:era [Gammaproteobacteria bacterium]
MKTETKHEKQKTYCGYVGLIGRPNVGKSTLLNQLLSQKISITSRKPQTTRHRILGIHTDENYQTIYVDTPGVHIMENKKALNAYLNRTAKQAIHDVDIIIMVIEALKWTPEDDFVLNQIEKAGRPVLLIVNKIDKVKDKDVLLPFLQSVSAKFPFKEIFPVSARRKTGLSECARFIQHYLPESPHFFLRDQLTDRDEAFRSSEIIREKLTRALGQELPYVMSVEIEKIEKKPAIVNIDAIIWVERDSQKGIIIGKSGQVLKDIGSQARIDMEFLFEKKVFLRLWTKTRSGWSDDLNALRSLGYSNPEEE